MRWDRLFDDLEGQLEHELGAEETDLGAEEERLRLGRLGLRDRVLAIADLGNPERAPLALEVGSGEPLAIRASAIGRDWVAGELVGELGARRSVVIPLAAVSAVRPSGRQLLESLDAEPGPDAATSLSARLGLAFVLRDLCRRRVAVDLGTRAGALHGTIDRVGRDHLDLAEHDPQEPRRRAAVRGVRIVPFSALLRIRH